MARAKPGGMTSHTPYTDIPWRSVIKGRVLILGDMNAHSTMWNHHCRHRQNAGPLEEFIERYELLVNSNTDFPTRPESRGVCCTRPCSMDK